MANRRLDVAEYMLDEIGLGHDVIGGGRLGVIEADAWYVCSSQPRANASVRSGTRIALIVAKYGCN
jgi:hypothetical protein